MKSDQEFIKGIYEKAEVLRQNEENDTKNYEKRKIMFHYKKNRHIFKVATIAAVFCLILTSVLSIQNMKKENSASIKNEPIGIANIDARSLNITEQLVQNATDIIKINTDQKKGKNSINIRKRYKGDTNNLDILNYINLQQISFQKNETAIIFLRIEGDEYTILNIFRREETKMDAFVNEYGEEITISEIEQYTK